MAQSVVFVLLDGLFDKVRTIPLSYYYTFVVEATVRLRRRFCVPWPDNGARRRNLASRAARDVYSGSMASTSRRPRFSGRTCSRRRP